MKLSEELRSKKSRDNRELLNRAADRIDELEELLKDLLLEVISFADKTEPIAEKVLETLVPTKKGGAE
jgi:hypothetical protein